VVNYVNVKFVLNKEEKGDAFMYELTVTYVNVKFVLNKAEKKVG
jgi:hypothetical protein